MSRMKVTGPPTCEIAPGGNGLPATRPSVYQICCRRPARRVCSARCACRSGEVVEHGQHRGDADARADQHHGPVAGFERDLAGRWADEQDVVGLHVVVQVVRHRAVHSADP